MLLAAAVSTMVGALLGWGTGAMPIRSFIQPGAFEPDVIAMLIEVFEAACNEQPNVAREESPTELLERQNSVSATRFACGRPPSTNQISDTPLVNFRRLLRAVGVCGFVGLRLGEQIGRDGRARVRCRRRPRHALNIPTFFEWKPLQLSCGKDRPRNVEIATHRTTNTDAIKCG